MSENSIGRGHTVILSSFLLFFSISRLSLSLRCLSSLTLSRDPFLPVQVQSSYPISLHLDLHPSLPSLTSSPSSPPPSSKVLPRLASPSSIQSPPLISPSLSLYLRLPRTLVCIARLLTRCNVYPCSKIQVQFLFVFLFLLRFRTPLLRFPPASGQLHVSTSLSSTVNWGRENDFQFRTCKLDLPVPESPPHTLHSYCLPLVEWNSFHSVASTPHHAQVLLNMS
ncbi:hypothetical protein K474DRAFT_725377 [Panus rudis PR-1116 ss-1]|nr:hypothetical protein K474DRAFT_725377 [Panus rudis PR-1116 ss-1]